MSLRMGYDGDGLDGRLDFCRGAARRAVSVAHLTCEATPVKGV
jgi:hypothetical protein